MIFVTVGTHEQGFDRLIKKLDLLKKEKKINEEIIIQSGFTKYEPKYCEWHKLISYQDMWNYVKEARIVITHGGPASFVMPLQVGKIPIVVPRQEKYNEHVNDHQVDFARNIADKIGNIIPVYDIDDLENIIENYDDMTSKMVGTTTMHNKEFVHNFEKIVDSMF